MAKTQSVMVRDSAVIRPITHAVAATPMLYISFYFSLYSCQVYQITEKNFCCARQLLLRGNFNSQRKPCISKQMPISKLCQPGFNHLIHFRVTKQFHVIYIAPDPLLIRIEIQLSFFLLVASQGTVDCHQAVSDKFVSNGVSIIVYTRCDGKTLHTIRKRD